MFDEFVRERQREEIARMRVGLAVIAKAYSGATAWPATTTLKRMSTPDAVSACRGIPVPVRVFTVVTHRRSTGFQQAWGRAGWGFTVWGGTMRKVHPTTSTRERRWTTTGKIPPGNNLPPTWKGKVLFSPDTSG